MAGNKSFKKLGIIAGKGSFPKMLINHCQENKIPFFIAAIKDCIEADLTGLPHILINLGDLGRTIKTFQKEGVKEVVMIGGVNKSSLFSSLPDWEGIKFLSRLGLKILGDNKVLEEVIAYFESKDLKVIGISDIMGEILGKKGLLTSKKLNEQDKINIKYGIKVVKALGELDIGQAAIIQNGVVLGVEGVEGTDTLIKRCKELKFKGRGGVLVKLKKPQQEARVDLPTIGLNTLEEAKKAGLEGIAYQAQATLIAGGQEMISKANDLGLFLLGLDEEDLK